MSSLERTSHKRYSRRILFILFGLFCKIVHCGMSGLKLPSGLFLHICNLVYGDNYQTALSFAQHLVELPATYIILSLSLFLSLSWVQVLGKIFIKL